MVLACLNVNAISDKDEQPEPRTGFNTLNFYADEIDWAKISNGKKHLGKIQIKYWRPSIHYALKSVKEMYPLEHQKKVKRDPKLKDIVDP